MDYAYKVMFAVGVLYTFVSLILNGISGAFHLGSHFDSIGGHGHMDGAHGHIGGHSGFDGGDATAHSGHGDVPNGGAFGTVLSYFAILINPLVAVSFLTVSGGLGILGTEYFQWSAVKVLLIALVSGAATAFLLYRFISIPLYKSENTSNLSREQLIGTPAEVSSAILQNGFGKIAYTVNSIRFTAPAKHVEERLVVQGQRVVICKIENNVFYVTEIKDPNL